MKRFPAEAVITVLVFAILWVMFGSRIVPGAQKHDFLNLYAGASLALDGEFARLHDPDVQLARERRFVPELPALVPFVRPAFYAAMLAPLALLSFNTAFVVWLGLQIALLLACWAWAARRWGPDSLVFAALFLPAPIGITHGQDCIFLLVTGIGAYILAERNRPRTAGGVLALGLIKFHLLLLWPLAMIASKRWRMLAGFSAVAAIEFLASLALGGVGGLRTYLQLLTNDQIAKLNPAPELTVSIHSFVFNFLPDATWLRLLLAILVAAITLWAGRQAPVWRWWALTATGALLVVPHVYLYDLALLLGPLWLVIYHSVDPATRIIATLLSTPIPFLMTLAGRTPWCVAAPASLVIFLCALAFRRQYGNLATDAM